MRQLAGKWSHVSNQRWYCRRKVGYIFNSVDFNWCFSLEISVGGSWGFWLFFTKQSFLDLGGLDGEYDDDDEFVFEITRSGLIPVLKHKFNSIIPGLK